VTRIPWQLWAALGLYAVVGAELMRQAWRARRRGPGRRTRSAHRAQPGQQPDRMCPMTTTTDQGPAADQTTWADLFAARRVAELAQPEPPAGARFNSSPA
jgi:hypothetical protein